MATLVRRKSERGACDDRPRRPRGRKRKIKKDEIKKTIKTSKEAKSSQEATRNRVFPCRLWVACLLVGVAEGSPSGFANQSALDALNRPSWAPSSFSSCSCPRDGSIMAAFENITEEKFRVKLIPAIGSCLHDEFVGLPIDHFGSLGLPATLKDCVPLPTRCVSNSSRQFFWFDTALFSREAVVQDFIRTFSSARCGGVLFVINFWCLSLWVLLLCFPKKKPKGKQTTCVRHAANQVQHPRIKIENETPAVQVSRRRALRVLCCTCRLVGLGRGRSMRICQARTRARDCAWKLRSTRQTLQGQSKGAASL